MAGFSQEAIEAVGEEWAEISSFNEVLERLRSRKKDQVAKEGIFLDSKLAWKIACLQQAMIYRTVMLADGCCDAWNSRNVLASVLCARSLMETVSVAVDYEKQIHHLCDEKKVDEVNILIRNRSFGSKLPDWSENSINVKTTIGKVDKYVKGFEKHYDRLSEMCHPNYLGHYGMFGRLDRATATFSLSNDNSYNEGMFNHVIAPFVTLGLIENSDNRLSRLLPVIASDPIFSPPYRR